MQILKSGWVLVFMIVGLTQVAAQTLTEKHISVDGRDRFYLLYTPPHLDPSKQYPLVIVMHGGGGSAKQMVDFSGFNQIADNGKFVVMYPNGYKKSWNDGRVAPDVKANAEKIDDVIFIKTALEEITLTSGIDKKKIFATGISNGAMMSLYLAYHLSDRIRAVAPVSGSIPENITVNFRLSYPVSLLVINGTADNLIPFEGGPVLGKHAERGRVISTMLMIDIWKGFTNESRNPTEQSMPDKDTRDRCTATKFVYTSANSTSIELIRINNGGHTWPGGKQYLPRMIVGNVCRDFRAEELIWDFFNRQQPR